MERIIGTYRIGELFDHADALYQLKGQPSGYCAKPAAGVVSINAATISIQPSTCPNSQAANVLRYAPIHLVKTS